MLRALLQGFVHQARRVVLVRKYRLVLLMLPLSALISTEVYRHKVITGLTVALVDRDNSMLSRTIRTHLHAARSLHVVQLPPTSLEGLRQRLVTGELSAAVLLPAGLSTRLKRGQRAVVPVALDASNILVARTVSKALTTALAPMAAGVQLNVVKRLGVRKEQAMARVLPVTLSTSLPGNPATNYAVYIVPGLVFFLLNIFVLILATSVFLPHPGQIKQGPWQTLGALLFILALSVACGLGLFYLLLPRMAIAPRVGFGLVLAWLCAFVALDLLMVVSFHLVLRRPMLTLEAALMLGMLSLMLSGLTWPLDMFPRALADLAQAIPFTPFARGFQTFLHLPVTGADLAPLWRQMGLQALGFSGLSLLGLAAQRVLPSRLEVAA